MASTEQTNHNLQIPEFLQNSNPNTTESPNKQYGGV
jgi:hypothetical protein